MNLYHQKILEGRKEFLRLVQKQDRELLRIYTEASKQISYKLSKANAGSLTSRYLNELDKALKQYVVELTTELSKSTKAGIKASAEIASAVQLNYFDMIAPREDIRSTFNKMFTQLPSNITKQLISGNYYDDGKTLDKRLWNIANKNAKDIDTLIKVNVAKGANARDLAKQLDSYIDPNNRINSKPIYITNGKGKLVKLPPPSGISNNISYQAQRLARTSLTHASTESYIQGSKMNPFNKGLKWNLSPSHFQRMHGKIDICDEYSGQIFKSNEYPVAHCNCLCYPTQENIPVEDARDELIAWLNGESNAKLDKWMEDYGEEFGIDKNDISNSNVAMNKNGNKIEFNLDGMNDKKQQTIKEVITDLSNKYNTNLNGVYKGAGHAAGKVDIAYNMYLSSGKKEAIVHEFAHSLALSDSDKLNLTDNKEFWKEITKVRKEYKKACSIDPKKSISSYSHESKDEFMAEAFTQALLKNTEELGTFYGEDFEFCEKVLKIINKYFLK